MLKIIIDTNTLLSGLFFRGNERKLLEAILLGKGKLVLPEHVINETRRIIERKAGKLGNTGRALAMLGLIIEASETIAIEKYEGHLEEAKKAMRDIKDAPILAAIWSIKHDYFVTGDKDFDELQIETRAKIGRVIAELEK